MRLSDQPSVGWTVALVVGVAVVVGGCGPLGGGGGRPECDENTACPTGWICDSSTTVGVCAAVIIPYPCPDTQYLCLAQGILDEGTECIGDGECKSGLYCRYPQVQGDRPVCSRPGCQDKSDCPMLEACLHFECTPAAGNSCSSGADCGRGQYCNAGRCEATPPEGGNSCQDDSDCAGGRSCIDDVLRGDRRCSTCSADRDCDADPAGMFCNGGFCDRCNAGSCGEQQCQPTVGCVECLYDYNDPQGSCAPGQVCANNFCRQHCNFSDDQSCPSGYCTFNGFCSAEIGTPCQAEAGQDDAECGGGTCLASVGGASLEPFCTRVCDEFDPPCPAGSTCREGDVAGTTAPYCVPD